MRALLDKELEEVDAAEGSAESRGRSRSTSPRSFLLDAGSAPRSARDR